ncbi:MAG: DUF4131 domain-containing protein, partial [Pyrinomonadaceae bacterium]
MPHDRQLPNFNRFPMLWLAAAFVSGIIAAQGFEPGPGAILTLGAIFGVSAFVFRDRWVATIFVLFAFAVAGLFSGNVESKSVSPNRLKILYDNGTVRSGDPVEVEGVLTRRPEPSVDSVNLSLRADNLVYRGREIAVTGNVRLYLPVSDENAADPEFEISDLKYGSRIKVACRLEREDEYLNPGVITRREIFDRLDIDASATIKSILLIERVADESVFLPLAWVYDQRARLIDDLKNNLSRPAAGVLIAALL